MPPKRALIGRQTSNAKRIALNRANESQEQTQARLEAHRLTVAAARANESQEQTDARRENERIRVDASRSQETQEQTQARLESTRSRNSTIRWNSNLKRLGFAYDPLANYREHPKIVIGNMDRVCDHCHALKWDGEPPGMCCSSGKVVLPNYRPLVEPLKSLLEGDTPMSKDFLKNIRKYNSCFQMTSFGATEVRENGFMGTVKVQGQIYHRIGSLLPLGSNAPQFLQIYFMGDSSTEANRRCEVLDNLSPRIVRELQDFLHANNSYVESFKNSLELMPNENYKLIIRADKVPSGEHPGRFNEPIQNEVAIVLVGEEANNRDIVLHKRNNELVRVKETHRSYDALQYPLMFWDGSDGYHFGLRQRDGRKKVTSMDFYAYRLMVRDGSENYILKYRNLLNQFMVDMYAKIESERLLFIRLNQKQLRSEQYIHLKDAISNDADPNNLGRMVILPSTVIGSPRNMHEYAQDGMTYVRQYGRPDLFITFTCNPKWKEIQEQLLPGQSATERHDIVSRVFKRKLTKFIHTITKYEIFGPVKCWMYAVEWQKRGLPHAHTLVWCQERIRATDIDKIISAELPDPNEDPELYELVKKHMIHNPCGMHNPNSPCMIDGKCSKQFPKKFSNETQTEEDGYPRYRRRSVDQGGFTAKIKMRFGGSFQEVEIDNRWVVPYSPLLLKMFEAHINMEWCHSVKSIKYICKYIHKGSDQAILELQNEDKHDEIEEFQQGRYISSNEAAWRIFGFSIHERYPTVMHLSVHLENGQRVYFNENNLGQKLAEPPRTHLTAFFELCQTDAFARTIRYCDVARYYTWNASNKRFQRRKQGALVEGHPGIRLSDALGRVYTVHPSMAECYYLRMLLHIVVGPTSFEYLRTVDDIQCETFREACQMRGLLEDDQHWKLALEEAASTKSAHCVRHLFAIMLTACEVSNPLQLWNEFRDDMAEDILRQLQQENQDIENVDFTDDIYNQALIMLEDICVRISGKNLKFFGIPPPNRSLTNRIHSEILRETSYNVEQLDEFVRENEPLLVDDQRFAYDTILKTIESNQGGLIFLDAPGGTGKTFLINLLLAKIRSRGQIALGVASSGIAATLLDGGRTAHSAFKLPLNLTKADTNVSCNISKGTGCARVLQEAVVTVWDECTMAHKRGLEALDTTLQDLRSSNSLLGGAVVILAGDFKQILPVVPNGTPADQINACLKSSRLWHYVDPLKLSTNMRVQLSGDVSAQVFSDKLLELGNGRLKNDESGRIELTDKNFCQLVNSENELIDKVFPDFQQNCRDFNWLCKRAIIAPKVLTVSNLNLMIQNKVLGPTRIYNSIDTVTDPDQAVFYPVEFLNSLNPTGLPPHHLELKVGSIIMLIRNLDPPKLCNGTRLWISNLHDNLIEAIILSKCGQGEKVFIPRIPLIPSDSPFEFKRLQFPVQLAFAMSINKSQGQTFDIVGVHLQEECFSHGQLYVACSRVGSANNLFLFAPDGKTKNIVYKNVIN